MNISPQNPVCFTPASYGDDPNAPIYHIKPASLRDRINWRSAMTAEGVRFAPKEELFEAIKQGINAIMRAENRAEIMGIVDKASIDIDALSEDEQKKINDLKNIMQEQWPPYAQLVALNKRSADLMLLTAAQCFLVGWENVNAKFWRIGGRVADNCIDTLPEGDVWAIGNKIIDMLVPTKEQEKNFSSPLQSNSNQPRITAEGEALTAASGV